MNKVLTKIKHFRVEVAATQVNRLHRGITATGRKGIASTYEKTCAELVKFMLNLYLQSFSNDNLIKSEYRDITLLSVLKDVLKTYQMNHILFKGVLLFTLRYQFAQIESFQTLAEQFQNSLA